MDLKLHLHFTQVLHQVVGKRIIVIDHQDHKSCADYAGATRNKSSESDPLALRSLVIGHAISYICRVIDTDEKLAAFLPRLRKADWVAVDTEADSLHAYPEKLCLMQISIAGADELLDPL